MGIKKSPGYPQVKKYHKNPESWGFDINPGNKNPKAKKIPNPGDKNPETQKTEFPGIFRKSRKIPIVRKIPVSSRIPGFSNPDPDSRDFGI